MPGFTDTFNRSDGPLGADWDVIAGSISIVSARAHSASGAALVHGLSVAGDQDVSADVTGCNIEASTSGILLKASADGLYGYFGWVQAHTYGFGVTLTKYVNGSPTSLGFAMNYTVLPATSTLRLTYSAGVLSFYINGGLYMTRNDADYATRDRLGFRISGAASDVDTFTTAAALIVRSINVTPDPLWVGGGAQQLVVTGSNTSWTSGVPGSSAVTANHGTVSEQWTASATSLHFTYTPAEYVGPITFTESQYGLTDTINGTLTPQAGQGTAQCPFNAEFVAMANTTGIYQTPGQLTTTSDVVILSPTMNYQDALAYLITLVRNLYPGAPPWSPEAVTPDTRLDLIWDAINGGVAQPQALYSPASDQPVKLDTEQTLAALKALTWNGDYNLATVISDIAGSGGYNLTTLLAAIPTADNQPVLDLLAAIRGDTTTSLYTLLESLAGIRTINTYSLQDVLDAIHLLPTSLDGGYTTADRLANAAGFVGVLAAIAALAAVEAEDAASSSGALAGILALATELAGGVSSVLAALESLKALLGGGPNEYRPPVWPGEAHVDWGTAITIESNEPLIGEMHGVVVDITGCESGTRSFGYDGIKCYSHVGALGFCSDRGDMEPFQALGPTKGIYTVKTMASAFACRLFRGRNVRGTIQPWKIRAD